jgi:predicted kinase
MSRGYPDDRSSAVVVFPQRGCPYVNAVRWQAGRMKAFVLVGGWPGSGKTTLSRALALDLGIPYLSKDVIKEALMDALGAPATVQESRELGRAAVFAVLAAARGCHEAVIDSTWYPYSEPLVRALPGPVVEVRCKVPLDIARARYRDRVRDERHLDRLRIEAELWGSDVAPLGVGPLVEVNTVEPVNSAKVADAVRSVLAHGPST